MYWDLKIKMLSQCVSADYEGLDAATTNGCFDIFHVGHLHSLYQASQFSENLIVGLNSNSSVSKIKGCNRPINDQIDRARIIASLPFVSQVVIFDDVDPVNFLRVVRPRFHCKGQDYLGREHLMPEFEIMKEFGCELKFLEFVDDISTTKIIERKNVNQ